MKLQLIMLPQPILVSDEEIKDGDSLYYATTNVILKNYVSETPRRKDDYKIIAGIPELPSIDFSALSEEDCKKIGWVDIEKLADKYSNFERASKWGDIVRNAYKEGFKTAQSLNEKKFSEEQIRYLVSSVTEFMSHHEPEEFDGWFEEKLKILSQPKVFDVEVEVDFVHTDHVIGGFEYFPKVTKNQIKITKII